MTDQFKSPKERAQIVAQYLFINGAGERATQLALIGPDGRNLGGWALSSVAGVIERPIEAASQILQARVNELETQLAATNERANGLRDAINGVNSNVLAACMRGALRRADQANTDRERLRRALRAVEWRLAEDGQYRCNYCHHRRAYGHRLECAIEEALRPDAPAEPSEVKE